MAELKPKKIDLTLINNGQQYKSGDGIQPNAINDPIQASAYVQALVETQPDVSGAGSYGTPSVTISDASGTPQFIFRNLRGAGIANIAQSGEPGNSGTAYIITLDNGNKFSITAPRGHQGIQGIQGVSISSVVQTEKSTESSGKNVVTVNKTDGTSSNFTVYNGEKGDTGAQITGYEFLGEDKNGGYVYKLIFDNGVSVEFTAPKGNKGDKGDKGDTYTLTGADMVKIAQVTAPFAEPYIDEVVENEIQEQMVEATKGFTVIENVSNLVENNISFTKNYVSYNKLNDYVTLRLVGTANSLNATSSVNVATMSNVFAPNAETQKEVYINAYYVKKQ